MKPLFCLFSLLLFAACTATSDKNGGQKNDANTYTPPLPGTQVAADSMKTHDALNDFYFAVKLSVSPDNATANANGDYGFIYDLNTHYGPGGLSGKVIMPIGGKNLKPMLRRAPGKEDQYIIGFIAGKDLGGDGKTFQELYSVTGSKETVEIKALKSYRFN